MLLNKLLAVSLHYLGSCFPPSPQNHIILTNHVNRDSRDARCSDDCEVDFPSAITATPSTMVQIVTVERPASTAAILIPISPSTVPPTIAPCTTTVIDSAVVNMSLIVPSVIHVDIHGISPLTEAVPTVLIGRLRVPSLTICIFSLRAVGWLGLRNFWRLLGGYHRCWRR